MHSLGYNLPVFEDLIGLILTAFGCFLLLVYCVIGLFILHILCSFRFPDCRIRVYGVHLAITSEET